jgi:UDP-glucose 4-epimerase
MEIGEKRMGGKQVVLVTGAAGYWGSRVCARLASEPGLDTLGLDLKPLAKEIEGVSFIQADIRNPAMGELIREEGVDTLCHLAFVSSTRRSEAAFDVNVMGTIRIMGICAEAQVGKVVLRSSTAVYGAHRGNPAFLKEDWPLRGSRRYGYTRDMLEIEAFLNGFRRQAPGMRLTVLRFPSIVGPTADTPMTRFLRVPWTPSLLGFDPLMQLIHEEDVVAALAHAVLHKAPGVFNVAAEDVLPLNKVRGLAGKPPFPVFHPFAYWGAAILGSAGLRTTHHVPIELDYLRYQWVADLSRMREELEYTPRYTAEEALREFAEHFRLRRFLPESEVLARGEQQLRDVVERRRRDRERQAEASSSGEEGGQDE